jgi:hypothetical protein
MADGLDRIRLKAAHFVFAEPVDVVGLHSRYRFHSRF